MSGPRPQGEAKGMERGMKMGGMSPVSYTHLDVYKRQTWLCGKLGGCYADLMGGQFPINFLEAKRWDVDGEDNPDEPEDVYTRQP